jgi:hypothetical protein
MSTKTRKASIDSVKLIEAAAALGDLFCAECPPANIHEQQVHRYGIQYLKDLREWTVRGMKALDAEAKEKRDLVSAIVLNIETGYRADPETFTLSQLRRIRAILEETQE